MIKLDTLPQAVKSSLTENETAADQQTEVCPAVLESELVYYYFNFLPSGERLFIQNNGSVPKAGEVEKAAVIYHKYLTSLQTVRRMTGENSIQLTDKRYDSFYKLLKDVEFMIIDQATEKIQKAFSVFFDLLDTIKQEQRVIGKYAKEAEAIANDTVQRGSFTVEEQEKMEQSLNMIIQAQVRIDQKKEETADSQAEVMEFFKEEMWMDVKLMLHYVRMKYLLKTLWKENNEKIKNPDQQTLTPRADRDPQFKAFIVEKLRNN